MSGTRLDMGEATPGQPNLWPYATNLTVHATAPYTLTADAPASFVTGGASPSSMPIGRLSWRQHAALGGAFTPFMGGGQVIRTGPGPTPPEGSTTVLDLRLLPTFTDPPSAPGEPYAAVITFTVTAGTIDQSYAAPNPFSPDGDGVSDRTVIHWYQAQPRVVDALVYDASGTTVIRTLTTARALGPGEQTIDWDGRDDQRNLAPEADYLYRVRVSLSEATDPGLTLGSGLVGLERGVGTGTATVMGTVTSSQDGRGVPDAQVELYRAGGSLAGTTVTDAAGAYVFGGVGAGLYVLKVTAPLHFPYASPEIEVADGATVVWNVRLAHNHSLTIFKTPDTRDAEPGDVVGYLVEVIASGVEPVEDVVVTDDLPDGLSFLRGSARLSGRKLGDAEPHAARRLEFTLGRLEPGQKVELYYQATVQVGVPAGRRVNSARATGLAAGTPVEAGPTQAPIFVRDGELGDRSLLFGRVFIDRDGNGVFGEGDTPVRGARVVVDDGTIATADHSGRYSIRGIRAGQRGVMAVVDASRGTISGGLVPAGPSRRDIVDVMLGVAARVDFAFTPGEVDGWNGELASDTVIAAANGTVGLDLTNPLVLRLSGRLAGFVEKDLGRGYVLTGWADTSHQPRDEYGIGRDEFSFQPEVGDLSTVAPSTPDKLALRLRAPWGHVILGRNSVNFGKLNLINNLRTFLGLEVAVEQKRWGARAFVGLTETMLRLDEIENDGGTGPFRLSAAPLLPGSDRVLVVGRDSTGIIRSRTPLSRGSHYTIDYPTGQIFLVQPWPIVSSAGETYTILVQYEWAPYDEIPPTVITGGRVAAQITETTAVGASALIEDGDPESKGAAGLDARYVTTKLDVAGEVAVARSGSVIRQQLPGDDATAARVISTYRPREDLSFFGFGNRIGGAYNQRIDFQPRTANEPSFGYLPPPSQTLIGSPVRNFMNGYREFPFVLQPSPDMLEWGLGATWQPRRDLELYAGNSYSTNGLDEEPGLPSTTRRNDYVAANYTPSDRPSLFLATTGNTNSGSDIADRLIMAASRWETPSFGAGLEYRFLHRDTPAGDADITGHAALLRARYQRWGLVRPAALVEASRNTLDATDQVTAEGRRGALGFEASWGTLRAYSYGSLGMVRDRSQGEGSATNVGGFAGATTMTRRLQFAGRVDASRDSRFGRQMGLTGRTRAFVMDGLTAYANVSYRLGNRTDPVPQWNNVVGLAWRQGVDPFFHLFLKYQDRRLPGLRDDLAPRRRTQLATLDLVIPFRLGNLGTRLARKQVRSGAGDVELVVAAEELTWRVRPSWDLVVGTRIAKWNTANELTMGSTIAGGYRIAETVRIMLGLNHARHRWAFEADESIPGVFLNVTGVYGSAGAAAVEPPPAVAPAPVVPSGI